MRSLIRKKEVKPSEIVSAIFSRIEEANPRVNAFCTLIQETAMAEARAADEKIVHGKAEGALFGLSVSIKDLVSTKGVRTTYGSKICESFVPGQDEVVIERLKAAGAILIGKTNCCEYGYKAVTDNRIFGPTRNPWNLEMTSGGSSGGAGAAVALGMGPLALGTDSGGSIRVPASYCGVFGFKPSRGRIPIYPMPPGWETAYRRLNHYGPLTRTVGDTAMMMEAVAGPDDRDPSSLPDDRLHYVEEMKKGIRGLRIAFSRDMGHVVLDPVVRGKAEAAASIFSKLGCHVEEATPDLPSMDAAYQILFAADCAAALGSQLERWRDHLDGGLVKLAEMGSKTSAADYVRAANESHVFVEKMHSLLGKYDLLLTPTLPLPPFQLGIDWPRETACKKVHPLNYLGFTYPFNLTGQPAASLPCGWTKENLPIGLQVIGRRWDDVSVLRASAAFEEASPWKSRWPDERRQSA
jgi:aspartyl-tRNA(Asn)/glutamyl-tRNA(Gln) amidotransferase subunit A